MRETLAGRVAGMEESLHVQDGVRIPEDDVRLRVAPVLFHHHGQRTVKLFTTGGNHTLSPFQAKFVFGIETLLKKLDITYPLYRFNRSDDIWAQDFFEPGYPSMPAPDNETITLQVIILLRSGQSYRRTPDLRVPSRHRTKCRAASRRGAWRNQLAGKSQSDTTSHVQRQVLSRGSNHHGKPWKPCTHDL
ncbi:hypothetical protein VTO42DRAFT_4163 [Malbranchea cinnamomea]